MKIELMPVRDLLQYANNARTHSRKQIRLIAKSIERFGFCNPVLIDDSNQIIAGHGRVEAAKLLGIEVVPTCRLSHLTETDKRAYILADNKIAAAAGWDKDLLAIELQGLIDLEFDLDLTGFDIGEVDLLLEMADEAKDSANGPEDAIPNVRSGATITQLGDMWCLGNHTLLCADARDEAAYEGLLNGAKAQFVFTAPPFNASIDEKANGPGKFRQRESVMGNGEMNEAEFADFLQAVFMRLAQNTADGSIHQVCMDWRHISEMLTAGRKVYSELKSLCVWNKTKAGMGSFYRSKHELVFIWKSGKAPHIDNFEPGQHGRVRSNVWDFPVVNSMRPGRSGEPAMHPTVKPVAMVAEAIKDCSHRGGLVLDPFCGSGTILIAAERTGRKVRAMECDPHYVDVAVRRWQTYTGKSAVLANCSETFEAVEAQRIRNAAAA